MADDLRPSSRPDRKCLWIRFSHPILNTQIRVDLGRDPQQAQDICSDLSFILANSRTWGNREHPDLDGLHPQAMEAFFGETERRLGRENNRLRHDSLDLRIQLLQGTLRLVSKQIEWLWEVSSERKQSLARGNPNKDLGFDVLSFLDETCRDESCNTPTTSYLFRLAFRDGTLVYLHQEVSWDEINGKLGSHSLQKADESNLVSLDDPDRKFLPELRAIFGRSDGWFEVPASARELEPRYKLIYRIACRDGTLKFADGCVAYRCLIRHLRREHTLPKCEISAALPDKLPQSWTGELSRLYPAADGGYAIPFPEPVPKRTRRKA
ncbi:MAG TPA: hypothetical protein VGP72_31350 [Planctomycetota bacterium]|jgi:hypothetical protein